MLYPVAVPMSSSSSQRVRRLVFFFGDPSDEDTTRIRDYVNYAHVHR